MVVWLWLAIHPPGNLILTEKGILAMICCVGSQKRMVITCVEVYFPPSLLMYTHFWYVGRNILFCTTYAYFVPSLYSWARCLFSVSKLLCPVWCYAVYTWLWNEHVYTIHNMYMRYWYRIHLGEHCLHVFISEIHISLLGLFWQDIKVGVLALLQHCYGRESHLTV